ncbi:MAG: SRPBCC domain-containing protein [Planctomycetes bacterium]|nr:SRPBCC domain-containing protein [Planctomycetota bacterium]
MNVRRRSLALLAAVSCLALGATGALALRSRFADPEAFEPQGFRFEMAVALPGSPFEVFDAFTGDVKPWWDHSFSGNPAELVIEPKIGGSFREVYDEKGNGCEHARITHVQRGTMLRMVGPLGLAGKGIELEMVFRFDQDGETTNLKLEVHALGKLTPELAKIVQKVWHHFLVERFEPYLKSGKHREKKG